MQLKKIRLAGFKSFVDPTTIVLPSNLVGVVGPNGCGKSNIIDAVRWVLGESRARQLRGESMDDVIFNGSSARKPVGKAMVDLIFDNSSGRIGGQYAQYQEISIRRELTRDGASSYFLNGTRCRRRDIQDVFLGTGLGPGSYAIIEQGMISRLVEAKPEELRGYLEEAAGISRYKERRRETEHRLNRTNENLLRIKDIHEEIEKRLKVLERQAAQAEKYREYKEQARELQALMIARELQGLAEEVQQKQQALQTASVEMERLNAEQTTIESTMESTRLEYQEASERFDKVLGDYHGIGSKVSHLESSIQHAKQQREQ
ncbi:MAG: chromosome segregation protein SMC, partial [Gammaproteobacteria bacterium]